MAKSLEGAADFFAPQKGVPDAGENPAAEHDEPRSDSSLADVRLPIDGLENDELSVEDIWSRNIAYPHWLPFISQRLNNSLENECLERQQIFERLYGRVPNSQAAATVEKDVVQIARLDVARDLVVDMNQHAYGSIRDVLGWAAALLIATLWASRGPAWLEIALVLTMAIAALVLEVLNYEPEEDDSRMSLAFLWAVIASLVILVALLLLPREGLNIGTSAGVAFGTACVALVITLLGHWVIVSLPPRAGSALMALLVFMAALIFCWRARGRLDPSVWWQVGLGLGVASGVAILVLLAALQCFGLIVTGLYDQFKLRRMPESEFVETALSAIALAERAQTEKEASHARAELLFYVEHLARFLRVGVVGVLTRQDRSSAAIFAEDLGARANTLRAKKRAVLLRENNALAELTQDLQYCVIHGALRQWMSLPVVGGERLPAETAHRKLRRLMEGLLLVAVPAGVGIAAWRTDQPSLVVFAALWAAGGLIELITPSGAKKLSQSASSAKTVWGDVSFPKR